MKGGISPEEKLLKLIKGGKDEPLPEKKELKAAPQTAPVAPRLKPRKIKPLLFAVSLIYLFIVFVYPWVAPKKIKLPAASLLSVQEKIAPNSGKENRPLEYYLNSVQGRKVFGNISSAGQAGQVAVAAAEADSLKDINLLGVVLGDNPQAIIEDKKTQKTVYVGRGQFVGQFEVEDIREGKVILNYKGKRYELGI